MENMVSFFVYNASKFTSSPEALMHTLRSDINYTVTGLILYTLLRYGVFVLESLVYRA